MSTPDYQLIEEDDHLSEVCHDLMHTQYVALDTEFVRERTFYPIPGLIQLADENQIYLVDPLKVTDLQPFLNLLENPFVTKVMHSASEDIELFFAMGCTQPKAIFDTQIAATWLGAGLSLSLANLVKYHTEIELDKSQTRTNWLARPLSAKQSAYAALDVKYLLGISKKQQELLASLGFAEYVKEDCEIACMVPDDDLENAYLQIKRAHYLKGRLLGKLS
ncbi:MAG: ribonuclease D, partial [Enterobacterales bacterium]|nr:ribonuclease D [Enterobacterales bacterium]